MPDMIIKKDRYRLEFELDSDQLGMGVKITAYKFDEEVSEWKSIHPSVISTDAPAGDLAVSTLNRILKTGFGGRINPVKTMEDRLTDALLAGIMSFLSEDFDNDSAYEDRTVYQHPMHIIFKSDNPDKVFKKYCKAAEESSLQDLEKIMSPEDFKGIKATLIRVSENLSIPVFAKKLMELTGTEEFQAPETEGSNVEVTKQVFKKTEA